MKNYKLYIYELRSGENTGTGGFEYKNEKVGIISESDKKTLAVLNENYDYGDCYGDVKEFEQRDDDGGHKHLKLLKVVDAKPGWVNQIGVGRVRKFTDRAVLTILFDAKEFVKQLAGLDRSQLDALIEEINEMKKEKV